MATDPPGDTFGADTGQAPGPPRIRSTVRQPSQGEPLAAALGRRAHHLVDGAHAPDAAGERQELLLEAPALVIAEPRQGRGLVPRDVCRIFAFVSCHLNASFRISSSTSLSRPR